MSRLLTFFLCTVSDGPAGLFQTHMLIEFFLETILDRFQR